ncbi:hypothetical protein [Actinoplanes subtropicus]|uniref:hypothetical protein n=1 Tax=Actinoplanes subtropicus TaxID=543632 RepID=UPI000AC52071|nr:hypothetical protein [Actinoplanes subtropicus]
MNHVLQLIMAVPRWLRYLMIGLPAFGESAAFVGLVLPASPRCWSAGFWRERGG